MVGSNHPGRGRPRDCDACLQACPVNATHPEVDVPDPSFALIAADAEHLKRH